MRIIKARMKGKTAHLVAEEPERDSNVVDLMERLRQSLASSKGAAKSRRAVGRVDTHAQAGDEASRRSLAGPSARLLAGKRIARGRGFHWHRLDDRGCGLVFTHRSCSLW